MRHFPPARAFQHAVRSTIKNIRFAWHVSWPWLLVLLPLKIAEQIYVQPVLPHLPETGPTPDQAAQLFVVLAPLWAVTIVAFSSIAVSWHRYVLRDIVPHGLERLAVDAPVRRYLGNLILLTFIIVGLLLVPTTLLVVLGSQQGSILLFPLIAMLSLMISFRLSLKFPAIALGLTDFRFASSFNLTKGQSGPIALYALLVLAVSVLVAFLLAGIAGTVTYLAPSFAGWLLFPLQMLLDWVMMIFGITILTSLYGFFVEGRDF
jgi:hypothetical protein